MFKMNVSTNCKGKFFQKDTDHEISEFPAEVFERWLERGLISSSSEATKKVKKAPEIHADLEADKIVSRETNPGPEKVKDKKPKSEKIPKSKEPKKRTAKK